MIARLAVGFVAVCFALVVFGTASALHLPGQKHEAHPVVDKVLQPIHNHSLHYGTHHADEIVLFQDTLRFQDGNENTLKFPAEGVINESKITAIEIIDLIANGKYEFVYHYGGVDYKDVVFVYYDNIDRPYNFRITVYTRKQ